MNVQFHMPPLYDHEEVRDLRGSQTSSWPTFLGLG